MSDTNINNLLEQNFFWQKAVMNAIRETVKGEKKLQNALRNRNEIDEKLKNLGYNTIIPRQPLTMPASGISKSEKDPESDLDNSMVSHEEEAIRFFDSSRSKSSHSQPKMVEDDDQENPITNLFKKNSLDKIKKSQNSFNGEPMGENGSSGDESKREDVSSSSEKETLSSISKSVEWLHMRDSQNFEFSDSESQSAEENDNAIAIEHKKRRVGETSRSQFDRRCIRESEALQNWDSLHQDYSNAEMKEQDSLEQKLNVALAKRKIVNKKQKNSPPGKNKSKVKLLRSTVKKMANQKRVQKDFSSFIKFYLDVYKELCLKMPVKQIIEEATRRWQTMTPKQRERWTKTSKTTDF